MAKVNQLGNVTDVNGILGPTHQSDQEVEEWQQDTTSSPSTDSTQPSSGKNKPGSPAPAPTTEPPSKRDQTEGSTVDTTAGSGTAHPSSTSSRSSKTK